VTGAIAVLAASPGPAAGGGGGVVTPTALSWNDIYGEDAGSTRTLLIRGITAPIQIAATKTGSARLAYILNGSYVAYSGAFTIQPNDAIGWSAISTSTEDQSGLVTVTNITNGAELDTFGYTVYSSRGSRL
jgi:hypothetical protein